MTPDFYGFADFSGMDSVGSRALIVFMIVYLVLIAIMLLFAVAVYVFQSLGIYTIAKRRGIHHPGLAWVPIANMWILGSISDQYQYVVKGRIRNRRKVLLGLYIATYVLLMAFFVGFFISMFQMIGMESGYRTAMVVPMMGSLALYFAAWVISVIAMVFMYIAYYDLFTSCNPANAVLFLVLSIFFNVLLPFFVFACRKKDEGMPPRKIQVPIAPWTPVNNQSEPAWQPPAVPAETPVFEQSAEETAAAEELPAEEPIEE